MRGGLNNLLFDFCRCSRTKLNSLKFVNKRKTSKQAKIRLSIITLRTNRLCMSRRFHGRKTLLGCLTTKAKMSFISSTLLLGRASWYEMNGLYQWVRAIARSSIMSLSAWKLNLSLRRILLINQQSKRRFAATMKSKMVSGCTTATESTSLPTSLNLKKSCG